MKYLIWGLLIYLLWRWYTTSNKANTDESSSGSQSEAANDAEPMVQCAQCGLHLPVSEALPGPDGVVFCSREHRNAHSSSHN